MEYIGILIKDHRVALKVVKQNKLQSHCIKSVPHVEGSVPVLRIPH